MIYILPTDTCFWIWTPINSEEWYNKIYKIKNRWYEKPLAVMVNSFENIKDVAFISEKEEEFIKGYNFPFTVLLNPKPSIINKNFKNASDYKKIAVRVADNFVLKKVTEEVWAIFLTSANISGWTEKYSIEEIKEEFKDFKNDLVFFDEIPNIKKAPPSNIFEINDDWTISFLRQNYK